MAVHEAGHAVAAYTHGFQIGDVAIQTPAPMGKAFTTVGSPEFTTAESCRTVLAVDLAGRAAEFVLLGALSTSAAGDLEVATCIARHMNAKWELTSGFRYSPSLSWAVA